MSLIYLEDPTKKYPKYVFKNRRAGENLKKMNKEHIIIKLKTCESR